MKFRNIETNILWANIPSFWVLVDSIEVIIETLLSSNCKQIFKFLLYCPNYLFSCRNFGMNPPFSYFCSWDLIFIQDLFWEKKE